jgi:hypothetical protein
MEKIVKIICNYLTCVTMYVRETFKVSLTSKLTSKLLIINCLFIISCTSNLTIEQTIKPIKVTIISIDSTTLKTAYLIKAIIENKPFLIYSERHFNNSINGNTLVIGSQYSLILKEINYLKLDNLSFSLLKGNIYLDNQLIVKKGTKVFVSESINACFFMKKAFQN